MAIPFKICAYYRIIKETTQKGVCAVTQILPYLKLYTFIRTSYIPTGDPDEKVNQHWHQYYQLVYIRRGTGSVIADGVFYPVSEGDAILIRVNEPHSFACTREKLETYELKFAVLNEELDFLKDGPRYFCRDTDGCIKRTLKQIEQESDAMDALSTDVIALELCKLLLLMRRGLDTARKAAAVPAADADDKADALLQKVDAYISQHLYRNFTIRDLSNHLFMEYSYLSRLFSAKYGIRLKQYITRKRLQIAKEMITGSNLTMTEIAEKCGFETLYRLERIFKKEEGISPSEYRSRFRNKYTVMFDTTPGTYYQYENPEQGGTKNDDPNSTCC